MSTPQYFKIKEVAEKLSVNAKTVYRWLQSGRLAGIRLGEGRTSEYRISEDELKKFLKANGPTTTPENQE